jgi:pimeloyl-ACP methyl ester carboxylesterase
MPDRRGSRFAVRLDDGVRLRVEAHGDRDAPISVLFLHGWTLDRRIWHRQVTGLAESWGSGPPRARASLVSYDARGHGRSGATARDAATLERLGDDLAEVIRQAVPHGPVVLVGHSLGGMTIMEYAHRHPADFAARVAGLVLVSTTAEGATHTSYGLGPGLARLVRLAESNGARLLAYTGAWRPHRAVLPALRPGLRWLLFGDTVSEEDVRLTSASVGRASLGAIGGFRPSVASQLRLETLAALAPVPTAVLVGDRDRLTPPRCAEAIAAAVPGADLMVCPGAGHMLPLERPEEVTDAVAYVTARALSITR